MGLPVSWLARVMGGGSSVAQMLLGMNSGFLHTYEPIVYANLFRTAKAQSGGAKGVWKQSVGSGAYTDVRGVLTPTVSTDEFSCYIRDNINSYEYPANDGVSRYVSGSNTASTLRVRWSGSGEVKITTTQNGTAYTGADWTTSKDFTVTITGTSGIYVSFKGTSLTDMELVPTVWTTTYDAGDEIAPTFKSFITASKAKYIRMMDFTGGADNCETDWSQRSLTTDVAWKTMPYEVQIDMCNDLNVDLWINIPIRATSAYCTSLASLISGRLNSNLKVYVELGNEVWNDATTAFAKCTNWARYKNHTKYPVTMSGDTITWVGHGLSGGETVGCFQTSADWYDGYYFRYTGGTDPTGAQYSWALFTGGDLVVQYVDADHIKLTYSGNVISLSASEGPNWLIVKQAEASATTADISTNFTAMSEAAWAPFISTFTRSRVKTLLGGHSNNAASLNNARIAALTTSVSPPYAGNETDCDYLVTAPYVGSIFWSAAATLASGNVTPKVAGLWSANPTIVVYYRLYTAAATPTEREIVDATGAIGSGSITVVHTALTAGTAITGLTNSTAYKLYFVHLASLTNGSAAGTGQEYKEIITINFTYNTDGAITKYAQMSTADMQNAHLEKVMEMVGETQDNVAIAATRGVRLACYEGGDSLNYIGDVPTATGLKAAIDAYQDTSEYQEINKAYLYGLAYAGVYAFTWYKMPADSPWAMGTDLYNYTTDGRFLSYSSFNGLVTKYTQYPDLPSNQVTLGADPGSYPYNLYTLTDATGSNTLDSGAVTYTIESGNREGRFDISGNQLRLIDASGINWALGNWYDLCVKAKTAGTNLSNISYLSTILSSQATMIDLMDAPYNNGTIWTFTNAKADFSDVSPADNVSFVVSNKNANLTIYASASAYREIGSLIGTIPVGGIVKIHFFGYCDNAGFLPEIRLAEYTGASSTSAYASSLTRSTSYSGFFTYGTSYRAYTMMWTNSTGGNLNDGTTSRTVMRLLYPSTASPTESKAYIKNFWIEKVNF